MWNWLKNFFSKALRAFKRFLKEVYTLTVMIIMAEVKDLALETVKEIANEPSLITDEEKRNAAFERLKAKTVKRGKFVKTHLLNQLIEMAVTYWKNRGEL